jgi:hypothetical protein
VSDAELLKKATDWLERQGYPLEMRVAKEFRAAGWEVSQSIYYVNDEDVPREIDVVAERSRWVDRSHARVQVVVECKKVTERPWVAFTNPRKPPAGSWDWPDRIASPQGKAFMEYMTRRPAVSALPFFTPPVRTAYAVTEAFHTGKDVPYGACLSVASAASTFASRSGGLIAIFLPIVIIEGNLVEAFLDPDGKLATALIPTVQLILRHPSSGVWQTALPIVTEAALGNIVAMVTEATDVLLADEDSIRHFGQSQPKPSPGV